MGAALTAADVTFQQHVMDLYPSHMAELQHRLGFIEVGLKRGKSRAFLLEAIKFLHRKNPAE